jgi:iron(III) transport system ATP-binding protein
MIRSDSLRKAYHTLEAVRNVSFEVQDHEFIAILGPSGCGKSTLLRLIAGLEQPDSGTLQLHGKDISSPRHFLAPEHRRFGMVFQDFALFPHMSVAANVAYGVNGSRSEKQARVRELLELVGLPHLAEKMPHAISGGEQQRIAVARALAPRPQLILMDEPFSNLDYQLRVQLRRDIRRILKQEGVAAILVTHDQTEAITFSDRVFLMQSGTLVQTGNPEEVYRFPRTLWAAGFVGEANFLPVQKAGDQLETALGAIPRISTGTPKTLMVRPEEIRLEPPDSAGVVGVVQDVEFSGPVKVLEVELPGEVLLSVHASPQSQWSVGDSLSVIAERTVMYDSEGRLLEAS